MKKIILIQLLLIITLFELFSQKKENKLPKCNTSVFNFSTSVTKIKNLCYYVIYDPKSDFNSSFFKESDELWFEIQIFDNDNIELHKSDGVFKLTADESDFTQYNRKNDEDYLNVKALIYDKRSSSWNLVLYDENVYRYISKSGLQFYLDNFTPQINHRTKKKYLD